MQEEGSEPFALEKTVLRGDFFRQYINKIRFAVEPDASDQISWCEIVCDFLLWTRSCGRTVGDGAFVDIQDVIKSTVIIARKLFRKNDIKLGSVKNARTLRHICVVSKIGFKAKLRLLFPLHVRALILCMHTNDTVRLNVSDFDT